MSPQVPESRPQPFTHARGIALAHVAALVMAACTVAAAAPGGTAAPADTSAHGVRRVELQKLLEQADSLVQAQGGSRATMARLYLTWDAPWGLPRASSVKRPRSHDPRSADTLWLSMLPGRTGPGFLGFTAEVYFHAAAGDTLGPWWHLERGALNGGEISIECGPDPTIPLRQPWRYSGTVISKLDHTPSSARLRILFAVPYTDAVPVKPDSVYALCRVVLHHHRALPGCSQPVCVEWADCELDYWLKDTPTASLGERFVSYAADTAVCAAFEPPATGAAVPAKQPAPAAARRRRARPASGAPH